MVSWCLDSSVRFVMFRASKCNKFSANWWEMFRQKFSIWFQSFCAPANGDNSDSETLCWWRLVVFVAPFAKKCSVMTISKNIDLLCKFIPSYYKRKCIKQNKCTYKCTPNYNDRKGLAPPWFHLLGEGERCGCNEGFTSTQFHSQRSRWGGGGGCHDEGGQDEGQKWGGGGR